MCKRIPLLFLSFILINLYSTAQEVITFERKMEIVFADNRLELHLELIVPQDIPNYQKVVSINCSHEPDSVFFRGHDQFYKFFFDGDNSSDHEVLVIKSTMIIYPYDFSIAKKRNKSLDRKEYLDPFLKKEPLINIEDKKLIEVADSISGESREEIVHGIFDFVVNKMDYKYFSYQTRGASKAVRQGLGDCTEYSELMIALCRIKGIPARIVGGVIAETRSNPNHNWVEVYFEEYGWVPFDPTYSEFKHTRTTFDKLPYRNYLAPFYHF